VSEVEKQDLKNQVSSQDVEKIHPCQKCGACCASFRVSFYWIEAESYIENSVPQNFIEDLDLNTRCMKGTSHKHQPKCVALSGRVGDKVGCEIYLNRPSPCRNFKASYENGYQEIRCDEARSKHGLKPLTKSNWK
jgi:uncharacterized protein